MLTENNFNEINANNLPGGEPMNPLELKWKLLEARWESKQLKQVNGYLRKELAQEYLKFVSKTAVGIAYFCSIDWIGFKYLDEPAEVSKWISNNLLLTQAITASIAILAPVVCKLVNSGKHSSIRKITKEKSEIKSKYKRIKEDCKQLEEKVIQTLSEEEHEL